ncbi:Os10g0318300 [Oryza sativa Japonica Group]|uniref:Os10g0318300 protein n=2 Tax=Oryza sativa subsp. japonica TaxID=39947 RepID=Q7G3Y8_ORYSJ|nr:Hypothetical protein [Oryza sativa Japonica Group]AAP52889.1 hypothetical protein LOC_Os10g17010 [Oryza sativa Japonica Group]BAF26250.1 Os10g0318300 [Oryza sativa Japonica Group]|eukprot:NP_001064336.1 Os10g0318300 [Oryza sativa Japonica Group]
MALIGARSKENMENKSLRFHSYTLPSPVVAGQGLILAFSRRFGKEKIRRELSSWENRQGRKKGEEDERVSCLPYEPELGARPGGGMGLGGEPRSVTGGAKSSWVHGTDKGRLET